MVGDGTVSIQEYLARVPDDLESARESTERYRTMSADERLRALSMVNAWADAVLGGRSPARDEGENVFWRRWVDPLLGRPGRSA